jgi:hypothetical protein
MQSRYRRNKLPSINAHVEKPIGQLANQRQKRPFTEFVKKVGRMPASRVVIGVLKTAVIFAIALG